MRFTAGSVRVAGLLAAALFGIALVVAAPASADVSVKAIVEVSGCEGGKCGYGYISPDRYGAHACDTRADGYGLRVTYQYRDPSGDPLTGTVRDPNGSEAGCGTTRSPLPITYIKVCSMDGSTVRVCTGWHDGR
jgi:hypothetical protein